MIIDNPTPSQIPALRSLWREAFGDSDEFLDIFMDTAFSLDRCRCVTIGGNVVAALYWFNCSFTDMPVAYIYAVATAYEYRGQGICQRLMSDTHSHLSSLGYRGALLVPGHPSLFDFYERIGYRSCCSHDEIFCTIDDDAIDMMQSGSSLRIEIIDKYEYATLRRVLLPEGGVVQEGENLDFLAAQVKFYRGEDFLLAAYTHEGGLIGVELLGDKKVAAKLTYKLGCSTGLFRTPGQTSPFAMYLPLDECALTPSYFGFAFD